MVLLENTENFRKIKGGSRNFDRDQFSLFSQQNLLENQKFKSQSKPIKIYCCLKVASGIWTTRHFYHPPSSLKLGF